MNEQVSFSIPIRRWKDDKSRWLLVAPQRQRERRPRYHGVSNSQRHHTRRRRRKRKLNETVWHATPQWVWSVSTLVALLWLVVVLLYARDDGMIESNVGMTRHRNLNALANPNIPPQSLAETGSQSKSIRFIGPQGFPLIRALNTYNNAVPLQSLGNETSILSMCAQGEHDNTCSLVECANRPTRNDSSKFTAGRRYIMENRDLDKDRRLGQIPQTLATNGCVISHQYKFVYIHVLKSGGMSLKSFLKKALCGDTTMPCRQGTDVLQVVSCEAVFRAPLSYQDYLVWSVVRNPYDRLYSGYAMAKAFAKKDMSFDFRDFVLHSDLRSSYSDTDTVHYQPQHEFLFASDGCPVVDYALHLESIQRDLPTLLSLLDSVELSRYYSEHGLPHASDTDYGHRERINQLESVEGVYTSLLREMVMQEYAKDFQIFGYDKL